MKQVFTIALGVFVGMLLVSILAAAIYAEAWGLLVIPGLLAAYIGFVVCVEKAGQVLDK